MANQDLNYEDSTIVVSARVINKNGELQLLLLVKTWKDGAEREQVVPLEFLYNLNSYMFNAVFKK